MTPEDLAVGSDNNVRGDTLDPKRFSQSSIAIEVEFHTDDFLPKQRQDGWRVQCLAFHDLTWSAPFGREMYEQRHVQSAGLRLRLSIVK
jgi:hypothetical protein